MEEIIECLTDEEAGKIFKEIFRYSRTGETNIKEKSLKLVMIPIKQTLDRNAEKYEKKCKINRINGEKGGRPKKSDRLSKNPEKANGYFHNPNDNDNGNDHDSVPDHENKNDRNNPPKSPQGDYDEDFKNLWAFYPKRLGTNSKQKAYRCYKARLKEGHTHEELLASTVAYQAFCRESGKLGTEYVMSASVFYGRDKHFLTNWEEQINAAKQQRDKPSPAKPGSAAAKQQSYNEQMRKLLSS